MQMEPFKIPGRMCVVHFHTNVYASHGCSPGNLNQGLHASTRNCICKSKLREWDLCRSW